MLKKSITYKDFNDQEVTEDFYFNLSKAEIVELEMSDKDGFSEMIQRVIDAGDNATLIMQFKKIIMLAYGKKSQDGKRFIKNAQLREEFESTNAYSVLFMEMVTNADAATEFVTGIVPQGFVEEAEKLAAKVAADKLPEPPKLMREITRADLEEMSAEDYQHAIEQLGTGEAKMI